jgi:uncharacterized membrane protein YfcA
VDLIEIAGLIVIGISAGLLGSAIGVGGGIIIVPALVLFFAFDQHLAQGTSLAVILPTAVVSTLGHARAGRVRWRLALQLAAAGLVAALVGARFALVIDADQLSRLFAVLLVAVAIRMAFRVRHLYRVRSAGTAPDGSSGHAGGEEVTPGAG